MPTTARSRPAWQIQLSFAARILLGAVMVWAGLSKIGNLEQSVQSVAAYQLIPSYPLVQMIGYGLPIVEVAIGLALLVGLFTRWAATVAGLLMTVFIIGISSAWARGLSIDCGCFGNGGPLDPKTFNPLIYFAEILRDALLLAMAVWLILRPSTPWSVDKWLVYRPVSESKVTLDDDDLDDEVADDEPVCPAPPTRILASRTATTCKDNR